MASSPERNFSNVFKVGTFDQIRYCVYVDPFSQPLKILLAEWSLRQKLKTALVACRNKELWAFSLNDSVRPAVPDSSFGLKEISTGSFFPSTLSISNSTSPQAFPAAYVPLMLAFASLISRHLTSEYDYTPLGSVLLTSTQTILHFSLRLVASGTLLLLPHYHETSLERMTSKEETFPIGAKIVLAPNGLRGVYCGISPGPPKDAAAILSAIHSASGVKVFHTTNWCTAKLDDFASTVFWPSELCLFVPSSGVPDDSADIEWFHIEDPLTAVEEFITSLSQNEGEESPSNSTYFTSNQKRNATTVYPTPPDPSILRISGGSISGLASSETNNDMPSSKWSIEVPHIDDDTRVLEDDALLFGDEEVTDADFNFFDDDPGNRNRVSDGFTTNTDNQKDGYFSYGFDLENQLDHIPELKHGTSINLAKTNERSVTEIAQVPEHVMTPPLSPLKIVTRPENTIFLKKRKSVFSPVKFAPDLENILDKKYSSGGRFFVPEEHDLAEDTENSDGEEFERAFSHEDSTPIWSESYEDGESTRRSKEPPAEDISSDSYISRQTWFSLLSATSNSRDNFLLTAIRSSASPLGKSFFNKYLKSFKEDFRNVLQILCEAIVWDNDMLESYMPCLAERGVCAPDFAHVLKAVFAEIRPLSVLEYAMISDATVISEQSDKKAMQILEDHQQIQDFMGNVDFLDVSGVSLLQTSDRAATNKTENLAEEAETVTLPVARNIFHIPPPHFSFLRMSSVLEALPPALRFWQIFGFSPQNGRKDVVSFIIFPGSEGMESAAAAFLDRVKPAYEGSNLGTFTTGSVAEYKNGLVPVPSNATTAEGALEDFKNICVNLGQLLGGQIDVWINLVIFVATPFTDPSSLLHVSQCVYQLKQGYINRIGGAFNASGDNLAFQLIPPKFFASKDTVVVPSQYDLVRFALGVYNKCCSLEEIGLESKSTSQKHYPAFTVARNRLNNIDFQLTSNPSPDLLANNSYLHIAYAISSEKKFVVVAWSDQYGELARVAAFPLATKEGVRPRTLQDVYAEIWESTTDLLPSIKIHWNLVFCRVGSLDHDEVQTWLSLSAHAAQDISVIVVCVNPFPCLSILETSDQVLAGQYYNIYSTPDATPQRQHDSPLDANGNTPNFSGDQGTPMSVATPTSSSGIGNGFINQIPNGTTSNNNNNSNSGLDQDAILVDLMDETFGVIVHHKLALDELDITALRFSLASGYLVKPGPKGVMMSILEISLLHCPNHPYDEFLEILLKQYRSLASYGAMTGVSDGRNNVLPWHIAAAEKMQRLLAFIL
ncbi:mediator complex subunit 13 C-terminal-domain-containing protein [Lipomyces japonicus]|uniref:mediator complex subunit 13 C-terminal-domain-containing protein n=1 Tax=Lipomyces japonicus TaxID=56871 RepID=UPI0034CD62A1